MDAAHLHLILTHFPIVGTLFGVVILAYASYAKSDLLKKTAFIIFVLMAVTTIPVFLTGEEAEEVVEHLPGVTEKVIEEHEELAEKAIWLMGLLGLLSIGGFVAIEKELSFAKTITLIAFLVSLATFGLFAQVGNLGGQIRHTEIRANNAGSQVEKNIGIEKQNKAYDDDDG